MKKLRWYLCVGVDILIIDSVSGHSLSLLHLPEIDSTWKNNIPAVALIYTIPITRYKLYKTDNLFLKKSITYSYNV